MREAVTCVRHLFATEHPDYPASCPTTFHVVLSTHPFDRAPHTARRGISAYWCHRERLRFATFDMLDKT